VGCSAAVRQARRPALREGDTVAKAKPSQQKRARERARQERQKEKEHRRQETKARKAASGPRQAGDEDPDLAGIIPGPQKPLWDEDEETNENKAE
jgi:hypothetical protein